MTRILYLDFKPQFSTQPRWSMGNIPKSNWTFALHSGFAGALHRDLKGEKSDKQLLYIIASSCRALSAPFPPLWVHRDVYELHIVAYRFLYKTIEASHFCRTAFWPLIVAVVGHPWFLDAPKLFSRVPVGTECLKIQPSSTIQIVHSRICIHHCSRACRNTSSLARP